MRSSPRLTVLLAVVTLLGATVAPAAAVAATDPRSAAVEGGVPGPYRLDAPANTTIEVSLQPDASARWRVTTTYRLESEEERAAFARYADDYRTGEADAGPRVDPFVAATERAAAATGREMTVTNVSRTGRVAGPTGSVTLSFRWTGFLTRGENDTLRLDDALAVGGERTWLGSLTADQTLVVRTPEGYSLVDSGGPSFEFRNNAIRFEGPREFDDRLSVTYRRAGNPGGERPLPDLPLALLGGALAAALVVAAVYVRRSGGGDEPPAGNDPPPGSDAGPPGAAGADADEDADEESEEETDLVDPDLLSDGERVEHLLERNDGRMKQAAIVEETGWSDAKVSQLLSSMADEGRVEKLRLGRENLISLPDDEE